ncbi:MAG TPA: hypothetical protein VKR38_09505 [Usitatibacter sp.]|nr:hypothetical protein [Usitatibacter sp.]
MTVLQGWIIVGLLVLVVLFLWDIGSRLRDILADTTQARDSLLAIQEQGRRQRTGAS